MYNRIIQVRKHLKKTQKEFGEMLGVSRDVMANIENNRVEPSKTFVQLLCSEFRINEKWLRTGEGEMLRQSEDDALASIAAQIGADGVDAKIIEVFLRLPAEQRKALLGFATQLADKVNPDEGKADK